jgi:ribosomal protein S18 acetylase RimI-like enzyme
MAQGKFHPECWWLVFEEAQPVGVTMLVEMPDAMTWELAYVGLIPEARGRGLGRTMMLHAMHALLAHPTIALTLAVDARNVPARRLYESLGFIEIEFQDVLLHLW